MCLATGRHSGLVGPGQLCLKKPVSEHAKKPYLESRPFPGALGRPSAPVYEVEYLQFAFRWMNNLLMRELPLRCTIRLWDTYQV